MDELASNTPAVTRSPVIPRETQDHLSLQNSHRPPIFHRDHSPAGGEQGGAGDAGKEGLVGAGAGVEVVARTVLRGHHVVAFPDSTQRKGGACSPEGTSSVLGAAHSWAVSFTCG